MTHDGRKPQRLVLHLGAAVAVTAIVPIADITARAATPAARLAALRAATNEGRVQLVRQAEDGTFGQISPQPSAGPEFDKSQDRAPFDKFDNRA